MDYSNPLRNPLGTSVAKLVSMLRAWGFLQSHANTLFTFREGNLLLAMNMWMTSFLLVIIVIHVDFGVQDTRGG